MLLAEVISASAFIYEQPEGVVSDELFMGWLVGITGERYGYYNIITHYGYSGFIKKSDVALRQYEMRKRGGEQLVVTGSVADVLKAPDVRSSVLAALCRGCFVTRLDSEQNGYTKIKTAAGHIGYVAQAALSLRLDDDEYLLSGGQSGFLSVSPCEDEQAVRSMLVSNAKKYLGTQYRWGGKSPLGIDCSGMVFMSYMLAGILICRDSHMEKRYRVREISRKDMREGDLMYFTGHVAMYIGAGRYIHSTGNSENHCCVINSLISGEQDYREDLACSVLHIGSAFRRD